MADAKISALPSASTPLAGTEVLPIVQSGSTVKVSVANLTAGRSIGATNKFIAQGTTDAGLTGAQFLGSLATGIVKNTTTTGVLSIAAAGTDYVAPTSGQVVKVSTSVYAPNALPNLYTGTNSDTLYYNSAFDQTVSVTAGNTLVVIAMGGGLLLNGAGDSFVPFLQIDGSDYQCGQIYYNAGSGTVAVQAAKASLSSSSVTVKFGGFSRYDNRTPIMDLRNSTSNEGAGNGALGGQFRWTFIEVKA